MRVEKFVIRGYQKETFTFEEKDFPVFFFQGAFSPPHKGHWLHIQWMLNSSPRARVILNQKGQRHGVPDSTNQKILSQFVLDAGVHHRVRLCFRASFDRKILRDSFLKDCTHFIHYRGFEALKHQDLEKVMVFQRAVRASKTLAQLGIRSLVWMAPRDLGNQTLSSTVFATQLRQNLRSDSLGHIVRFIPDHIRDKKALLDCLLHGMNSPV